MTQSSPVDHDDGSLLSTQISTIQNLLDSLSNHHHHHSSQQHHDMKQQQHMMTHDHHPPYHLTHNNNEQSPFISKQFKSRVATFTAKNWYHKPFAIRPPVCARYGYACVDVDVIQCVDCGVMLSFRLPSFLSSYCDDDDDDKNRSKKDHSDKNYLIVKKLCDGFIQKMKNAHCRTSCAYHHQSSPFQMLLFGHQFTYHENEDASSVVYNAGRMHRAKFLLRLKQVMSLSGSYLMFHERFMQVYVQPNRKMIESIMSVMFSSEQLQREREWLERCVWIAIFGWKVRPLLNSATAQTMMVSSADGSQKQSKNNHVDDSVKCLYCEYCQVRVPLLLVNNNNKLVFDPCDAHRFWCPCIHGSPPMDESYPVVNTTALANTVGGDGQTIELRIPEQLPGWKQVFSAIQTIKDVDDPFHLKSESVDCFQKLRHANLLLNSTLSPFYLKHMNRKKELRRLLDEREHAQNPPSIQEPEQVIPTETQIDEQVNDQVRAPTVSSEAIDNARAIERSVAEPREETEQAIVVGEQVELQPQESTATKTKSTTLPIQPEEVPREEEVSSEPLDTDELEFESHDSNLLTPSPVIEPNEGSQTPLLENEDESMDNQTDDESSTPPPPMSKKLMEKQPEKPATTGRVILLPTSNSSSTSQQPQNNNPNTRPKPSASQEAAPPQSTSSNKGNTRGSRATRGYRGKRKQSNQSASNRGKKAKR